jgi:serine phosphatase RsbU (regulator of sigma subunit)
VNLLDCDCKLRLKPAILRGSLFSPERSLAVASVDKVTTAPRALRRGPQRLHLPSWSQLSIAARQRGPLGHGGDFFEIIQHRDGQVSVVVADVCGNGPSASGPVSRLRWLLRQHLARGEAPGAVLSVLNDAIIAVDAPDLFVTAVCIRIDPLSAHMDAASAGHLGPFIKRARGDAEELAIPTGAALGILPDQIYAEARIELASEDALVLVTDGITDPLSTSSSPLGQAGLLTELARARPGAESICGALLRAVEPLYDATVVVLKLPRRHRRVTPVHRSSER